MYFYLDSAPDLEKTVELLLRLPTEVTGRQPRTVLCKGHIVRIEPASDDRDKIGIAVEFDSLEDILDS